MASTGMEGGREGEGKTGVGRIVVFRGVDVVFGDS